jgi:propionyl-CoA carboxylase alpha chain/3-methylcrotonyl-CoA carboxylase alpha subunit/acetyl-CoA/propionyl-CoA carboxylase biotin carboxyl carrier protein
VRFDGGIAEGQAVTPAFDSLLAKLIACADTRPAAAARLQRALQELVLLGVPSNIDYLARLLALPAFLAGELHTGFLAEHAAEMLPSADTPHAAAAVLAALLGDDDFRRTAWAVPEPHASIGAWRN